MKVKLANQAKADNFHVFEAKVSDIFWMQDPKGYFLIRINKKTRKIEVGFVNNEHEIIFQINGVTPQQIYHKLVSMDLTLRPEHWAYLGKELEKCFISLNENIEYVQDSALNFKKTE
jgi:hypothetical protein